MLFFDGVMKNLGRFLRRYLRTVCPRKSNPCSICVTTVFSGESSNPRSLRNCSTRGLTSCSRRSFELPVTQKSSAYRIRFTLARFPTLLVFENWEASSRSSPSSVIFAIAGEMMPPWGVPSSVGWKQRRSTYPALSHFLSMVLSIGMWANNHSCEIWSKQERMSPSSIHSARSFLQSAMKQASIASAAERAVRNP